MRVDIKGCSQFHIVACIRLYIEGCVKMHVGVYI